MKINKLVDYLRFGELQDLSVSNIDDEENLTTIFLYIDRALKKLNSELELITGEITFDLKSKVYSYLIQDPLLLRVTSVYDQDGKELYINIEGNPRSVFVSSYNIVQFVGHRDNVDNDVDAITVLYLQDFSQVLELNQDIDVSEGLLEVMTNYIAYLAHGAVNQEEGSPVNKYQIQYEIELGKARRLGYKSQTTIESDTFHDRGFV